MGKYVISVIQLNSYISDSLYRDVFLDNVWVKGEVLDLKINHNTAFFILSDGLASVNCLLFDFEQSVFNNQDLTGQSVVLQGNISLYKKTGNFGIVVKDIELLGTGEQFDDFNKLKTKLEKMGIFSVEHKKTLPVYPQKIGIVTSAQGAAIQDIIQIAKRRNPNVKLVIYPVRVQGEGAAVQISDGLKYINADTDADILIIGRGGGSSEDLTAFNDERVVMEIFNSKIPVISAVGHEIDFTLSDLAADLRASTPSAAAELAVPLAENLNDKINVLKQKIFFSIYSKIKNHNSIIYRVNQKISSLNPALKITAQRERLSMLKLKIDGLIKKQLTDKKRRLELLNEKIICLNPADIISRGYAIVERDGVIITSAHQLMSGDTIKLNFIDGFTHAVVKG